MDEADERGVNRTGASGGRSAMTSTWEPGLGDHLRSIWRRKWLVLGGAVFVAEAVFFVLTYAVTPRYEAEASLRLMIEADGGLVLDENRVEYASRVYAELAETPSTIGDAADRSGLDIDPDAAASAIDVQWARPPGFIDVTASADDAEEAALLADAMAASIAATIAADTERLDASDSGTVLVAEIVEPAIAPSSAAWPRPIRESIVAFLITLVVLAEVVALWRPLRGLLPLSRTAELVTDLLGVPCITLTGDPEDRTRLGSFAARHLATAPAIAVVQTGRDTRPAVPLRLGEALTASGRPTLVVDGDPLDPSMHWWLGLPRRPGLQEVMAEDRSLADAVYRPVGRAEVSLLTAGGEGDDPATRERETDGPILDRLPGYACVVVSVGSDSPIDDVAASLIELRRSTVLVVDPERTTRRRLAELVHGYGGQEDVIAIILMANRAAVAETKRLAARSWEREGWSGDGAATRPRRLTSLGQRRQAS
ncbi:MAG: hypothetical protein AAGA93_25825 [Actinomycetota bacterium]